jgi:hypothetical protein
MDRDGWVLWGFAPVCDDRNRSILQVAFTVTEAASNLYNVRSVTAISRLVWTKAVIVTITLLSASNGLSMALGTFMSQPTLCSDDGSNTLLVIEEGLFHIVTNHNLTFTR